MKAAEQQLVLAETKLDHFRVKEQKSGMENLLPATKASKKPNDVAVSEDDDNKENIKHDEGNVRCAKKKAKVVAEVSTSQNTALTTEEMVDMFKFFRSLKEEKETVHANQKTSKSSLENTNYLSSESGTIRIREIMPHGVLGNREGYSQGQNLQSFHRPIPGRGAEIYNFPHPQDRNGLVRDSKYHAGFVQQ